MSGNREQLGAAIVRLAEIQEFLAAHLQDERDGRKGLGIVDRGRFAIQAERRRERRLESRLPLLALDRLEQRGFLAADVSAVTVVGEQFEVESGTKNILADETGGARFVERFLEAFVDFPDFAVHIVVAAVGAHREGGDRHAFDHRVRIEPHDVAVLERSRFAFVRIANHVFVTRKRARHERPLQARREASAAATTQDGFLDLADDLFLGHLRFEDAAQLRITAAGNVILEAPRIVAVEAGHQDAFDRSQHRHYLHSSSSLSICSGCMWLHMLRLLTIITGASPQAPMHSPSFSVNLPSAVVSP